MSKLFHNIDNIVTSPTAASAILSNEEYSNLTVEEYELRLSVEDNINKLNYYNDQLEASIEEYEAVSHASGLSTEAFLETAKSASRRLGIPIDTVNISSEGLIQGIARIIGSIIKAIWNLITKIWDKLLTLLGIRSKKIVSNIKEAEVISKKAKEYKKSASKTTGSGADSVNVMEVRTTPKLKEILDDAEHLNSKINRDMDKKEIRTKIDNLVNSIKAMKDVNKLDYENAFPALALFGDNNFLASKNSITNIGHSLTLVSNGISKAIRGANSIMEYLDENHISGANRLDNRTDFINSSTKELINILDKSKYITNINGYNFDDTNKLNLVKLNTDLDFTDNATVARIKVYTTTFGTNMTMPSEYKYVMTAKNVSDFTNDIMEAKLDLRDIDEAKINASLIVFRIDNGRLKKDVSDLETKVNDFSKKIYNYDPVNQDILKVVESVLSAATTNLSFLTRSSNALMGYLEELSKIWKNYNSLQLDLI